MSLKATLKTALLGPAGMRVRTIRGGLLRGRQFPVDTASGSMQLLGLWEREITGAVRRCAPRAQVACDIGANTGYYAAYFASRLNIRKVFAIEADAGLVPVLQENLRRIGPGCLDKTTIISKFAGDHDDDKTCALDTLLANESGPIMFKIDVDGGEVDVLRGARQTLTSKPCNLVIETHSAQLERDCEAFLRDLGYGTRIIKNAWYRLFIPESRNTELNRWMSATKEGDA